MDNMNRYVETATDLNVEGIEFYVKENDETNSLYIDAEYTTVVDYETLKHSFEMNDVVIVDGDAVYRPQKFEIKKDNNNKKYVEVSYIVEETVEEVTSLKFKSVKSSILE